MKTAKKNSVRSLQRALNHLNRAERRRISQAAFDRNKIMTEDDQHDADVEACYPISRSNPFGERD